MAVVGLSDEVGDEGDTARVVPDDLSAVFAHGGDVAVVGQRGAGGGRGGDPYSQRGAEAVSNLPTLLTGTRLIAYTIHYLLYSLDIYGQASISQLVDTTLVSNHYRLA